MDNVSLSSDFSKRMYRILGKKDDATKRYIESIEGIIKSFAYTLIYDEKSAQTIGKRKQYLKKLRQDCHRLINTLQPISHETWEFKNDEKILVDMYTASWLTVNSNLFGQLKHDLTNQSIWSLREEIVCLQDGIDNALQILRKASNKTIQRAVAENIIQCYRMVFKDFPKYGDKSSFTHLYRECFIELSKASGQEVKAPDLVYIIQEMERSAGIL